MKTKSRLILQERKFPTSFHLDRLRIELQSLVKHLERLKLKLENLSPENQATFSTRYWETQVLLVSVVLLVTSVNEDLRAMTSSILSSTDQRFKKDLEYLHQTLGGLNQTYACFAERRHCLQQQGNPESPPSGEAPCS